MKDNIREVTISEFLPPIRAIKVEDVDKFNTAIEKVKEKIRENPLVLIPKNLMCNTISIKDPLQIISNYIPEYDDIKVVIEEIMKSVPNMGQLMNNSLCVFWKNENISNSENETKLKMEQLKNDIIDIIENKTQNSQIENLKQICESRLNELNMSSLKVFEKLKILKYKIINNEKVSSDLLKGVRESLNCLKEKIEGFINFCSNEKYEQYLSKYIFESISLYIVLLKTMDYYWIQFGYDQVNVVGCSEKSIKSFRELIHDKVCSSLKKLGKIEPNDYDLFSNVNLILKNDLLLYPTPLIIADTRYLSDCEIKLPLSSEIKLPYIIRYDAQFFKPRGQSGPCDINDFEKRQLQQLSYHLKIENELISNCKGTFLDYGISFSIELPNEKYIRLRVFGNIVDSEKIEFYKWGESDSAAIFNLEKVEDFPIVFYKHKNNLGPNNNNDSNNDQKIKSSSGIFQSKKFKGETFNFKLIGKGSIYFVEIIVSDN